MEAVALCGCAPSYSKDRYNRDLEMHKFSKGMDYLSKSPDPYRPRDPRFLTAATACQTVARRSNLHETGVTIEIIQFITRILESK